jgi:hypothetical protein
MSWTELGAGIAAFVGWLAITRVVLPRLGVPT